jgi:hypothetical protein
MCGAFHGWNTLNEYHDHQKNQTIKKVTRIVNVKEPGCPQPFSGCGQNVPD